MDKLYILDAVNYLFRSYYAIGPMTNDQGQSTSALFGFVRTVQKCIRDFSVQNLVCVFDGPDNKKGRQSVYADYKMHRKGAPEDLYPQFEWAYLYCQLAGIPVLCIEGVEADDTMATLARWAEKKGAEAYLITSDKDLMQLVNDHIFLLQLHKNNLIIDAEGVKQLYNVRPDQMLDLLAIMGDASDNIPGLEGFGPKTAASLLQEFGTLDHILAHPEKVKGEKKQEILRSQKEIALMSRELATLNINVKVPHEEAFYRIQPPNTEKLTEFFHKMKFNSLLKERLEPATPPPEKKAKPVIKQHYQLVDTEEELISLLGKLSQEKMIGIDTETTNIQPLLAHLVGIGFCTEPGLAWYVPLNGHLGKKKVLEQLHLFFNQFKGSFFGHNIKYDLHILEGLGFSLQIGFDTLLASYLLDPQKRRHNLDELVLDHFQKVKIPIEDLIGKGKHEISMRDVPVEKVKEYCCEDIDYTTRLKELFESEIEQKKLGHLFYQIDLPLLPILAKMEREGIYLDVEKLQSQARQITVDLNEIKKKIFKEVGEEFNLNSPKQLSHILYEKLKLKQPTSRKKTETGTGADILEELSLEHPVAQSILEYRVLEKLRSTYIEALPQTVNPITERIHCTFSQSVAATGRLSCNDPNLQNIPVRSKEGIAIRSCFKPQKRGWSFLAADYSQIELRLLAHFSKDKELLRAFHSGADIHVFTASLVFGIPEQEVTPEMRSLAKTVNFGIVYGQSAFGLSKQLRIPLKEASDFIKTYFERYPGVVSYLEQCKASVRKLGYSTTLHGRQRPIPEIHNKNPTIRAAAERLAINTPLQGTAADLIKQAMIEIDQLITHERLEGKMILQIHDELIFEIPDHEIPRFERIVKEKMEGIMKLHIPIEVHIAIGKNWAEC